MTGYRQVNLNDGDISRARGGYILFALLHKELLDTIISELNKKEA